MKRLPTAAVPAIAVIAGLPTVLGSGLAEAAYTLAFVFFVVLAWLGVRRQTGPARAAYALIASALTSWLAGDLLHSVLDRVFDRPAELTAADVFWVAGYPLLTVGLLQLVRLRAPGRLREAVLDGLAMTVVVTALFWQFLISPAVADHEFGLPELFGILYPFGDVLFFVAGALLVLAPGRRSGPIRYLIAAMALTFGGDVTISLTPYWFPGFDDTRLDALLLLANSLIAAALWHPRAARLAEPAGAHHDERLHPGRVVFLGIALLALPALADTQVNDVTLGRATILIAMVLLTMIVLTRFTLVVRAQERGRSILAHRAAHDQLTGLVNRQELHHRLTAALARGSDGGPVVHFLDLNGFKPINDRYGHAAGDQVLVEVAGRLRATVRATETVARLGGDEFVVVSPTVADAAGLTERLRTTIGEPIALDQESSVQVAVSIGVAFAGALEQPTSDALLAAADAAMYYEKALTSTY
ncbi:diguanylate cyclase domain-containing protein [Actinoplanes sp. NPDC049265]|uniref:diguanylate cyclase domain-containing protein n=1 Tax=Actinoplanes sp. NPDC049265 TaxID=3363902 RepID=UPI003712AEA9